MNLKFLFLLALCIAGAIACRSLDQDRPPVRILHPSDQDNVEADNLLPVESSATSTTTKPEPSFDARKE